MIPFPLYNKPKNIEAAEFKLHSDFVSSGDQPQAIAELVQGLQKGKKNQVLLGITGSGKTFTMAKIIEKMKKPALILAHNKTLAAQLYGEMKSFFPENAVEYFVSYYDYYQPEAYIPKTDKYIEKDSAINEQIDRMRHSATRNILERRDVIIVSSVSCIYGLGDVEAYSSMVLSIKKGQSFEIDEIKKILVSMQYKRNDVAFERGTFRVMGDVVDIFPAHYEEQGWRISFFGDEIENIYEIDVLTGHKNMELSEITIYPASHFVTPRPALSKAIKTIRLELEEQINFFKDKELFLEAQRIEQRTRYDLEMMETLGMCKGIENYSRHLTGRSAGSPPPTLFEYLPEDALLFVDESHVTLPQIRAMYKGDASRKNTLTEYGFRLPSCRDNRPLKFEEWDEMRPKTIFVSATPGAWELEQTQGIFTEQIIRPTGLLDPECFVRPVALQVEDLMQECIIASQKNQCVLVTTLTKKMAEYLTDYLLEHGLKVRYMHSDIDTLERVNIIRDLRLGKFNVLVGINLLREGLDIPECALVAILDADKESFLRSSTSLIQTIGRAARNPEGRVILYADHITKSMKIALDETSARRQKQMIFNQEHHIIPKAIKKEVPDILKELGALDNDLSSCCQEEKLIENIDKKVKDLKKQMIKFAENLEFEKAAYIRDQIKKMRENELKL